MLRVSQVSLVKSLPRGSVHRSRVVGLLSKGFQQYFPTFRNSSTSTTLNEYIALGGCTKVRDQLFVFEAGNGEEPVLMLHDLASTHKYWLPLLPHLNQRKFKYLVPDLLGHGRSPKSRHLCYDLDTHIQYIRRDILDRWNTELGIPKNIPINVIGHGMGAILALEIASRFPNRVYQVTLINLPYFESPKEAMRHYSVVGHVIYTNKLLCHMSTSLFRYNSWMWTPMIRMVTKKPPWLVRDCMKYTTPITYSSYEQIIGGDSIDVAAHSLMQMKIHNISLIHGDNNNLVPVRCADRFFRNYPALCRLTIFRDAGHDIALFKVEDLAVHMHKEILE
eukprot:TRINITY_DN10696_c0_g1_i5.p1 TRINITY_DN10696_c0_g1~~TRINITY_DN10696_c0_g1_i5.p1  ORF type:complete len:334 (-),score=30.86 TRINITY_DN10696_c0_g1_i5:135-1136(-)